MLKIEKPMVLKKEDWLTADRHGSSETYTIKGQFTISEGEKIKLFIANKKVFESSVPIENTDDRVQEQSIYVHISITEETYKKHGIYQGIINENEK